MSLKKKIIQLFISKASENKIAFLSGWGSDPTPPLLSKLSAKNAIFFLRILYIVCRVPVSPFFMITTWQAALKPWEQYAQIKKLIKINCYKFNNLHTYLKRGGREIQLIKFT